MKRFLQFGRRLGQPDILFWTLPYLIALVIIGTIAQKWMGLYTAQHLFFSSFISHYHGIPFIGGAGVLVVMALQNKGGGYTISDIPHAFYTVIGRYLH